MNLLLNVAVFKSDLTSPPMGLARACDLKVLSSFSGYYESIRIASELV